MAKLLKLRRGTTSQHSSFTGAEGEVTIDTDKDVPVVHDGSTAGGHPVAAEDMANVSAANIKGRLGTTLTNAEINASAAIAGTKISPDFGSQNVVTTGTLGSGDVTITSTGPTIDFVDSNDNPDYRIRTESGIFKVRDVTNNADRFVINTDGHIDISGNLDVGNGLDVTGNITTTGTVTASGNRMTISGTDPALVLTDNDNNPDYEVRNQNSVFRIYDVQADSSPFVVNGHTDGHIDINVNADFASGIDVTGNITCTGTVDGVDVATRDTLFGGLTSSSGVLTNGVTATTQSASDNTTKVATTAYVTTAIGNADAFPSGTKMIFQQTSAPTGWTKVTSSVDNKALRVVSGSAGSGGSNAFSNTFASRGINANSGNATQGGNVSVANSTAGGNVSVANASTGGNVNSHTLSTNEMPSHSHSYTLYTHTPRGERDGDAQQVRFVNNNQNSQNTGNAGGSGGHSHGFTGGSHNHNANFSGSAHNHNATFTGSAHNHSISVSNLDMGVQYLDVIIASKD